MRSVLKAAHMKRLTDEQLRSIEEPEPNKSDNLKFDAIEE
jgi:hypothetical protein